MRLHNMKHLLCIDKISVCLAICFVCALGKFSEEHIDITLHAGTGAQ